MLRALNVLDTRPKLPLWRLPLTPPKFSRLKDVEELRAQVDSTGLAKQRHWNLPQYVEVGVVVARVVIGVAG